MPAKNRRPYYLIDSGDPSGLVRTWLSVPIDELRELDAIELARGKTGRTVADSVSGFSKMTHKRVYLEGGDIEIFKASAHEAGWQIDVQQPRNPNAKTPVPNFGPYNTEFLRRPLCAGDQVLVRSEVFHQDGDADGHALAHVTQLDARADGVTTLRAGDGTERRVPTINLYRFVVERIIDRERGVAFAR